MSRAIQSMGPFYSLALVAVVVGGLAQAAAADDFVPFVIPAEASAKSLIALPPGDAIKTDSPRLTVKAGEFFRGRERFKVWGVNLCFAANFPTHRDAERVAARLAGSGVNSVRFHHLDTQDYPSGIWDPRRPNELSSEALERLDYFIQQLALRGIYANLNLHVGRSHSAALKLPQPNESYDKMVDLFTPQLIEAQRAYARQLLGHVNAYRKVRYADDPAVGFVEITNEDSLFMWSAPEKLPKLPKFYAKILQADYLAWLKRRYSTTDKLRADWNRDATPLGPNLLTAVSASPASGWALEQHEGCQAHVIGSKPIKNEAVVELNIVKADQESWHLQFNHAGLKLKKGEQYTVSFVARADANRTLSYNVGMAHEPWANLGLQKTVALTTDWQTFRAGFTAAADDENGRLNFQFSGNSAAVGLSAVTFQTGGGAGLGPSESLEAGNIALFPETEPAPRLHDRLQFLAETEKAFFDGMKAYLQHDLGCRANVTGTIVFGPLGLWAQQDMDYIDAHAYWQHPNFPGRDWDLNHWTIEQKALVDEPNGGPLSELACSRLAGKPFTVSEYNHPAPNDFQAECVPLLAAFGAAQDWDGVWFFAYSHDQGWDQQHFDSFFDMKNNPAKWGFFVPGAIAFRSGAIAPTTPRKIVSLGAFSAPQGSSWLAAQATSEMSLRSAVQNAIGNTAWAETVKQEAATTTEFHALTIESPNAAARLPKDAASPSGAPFILRTSAAGAGHAATLEQPQGWLMIEHHFTPQAQRASPEVASCVTQAPFAAALLAPLDGEPRTRPGAAHHRWLLAICARCENAGEQFSADRRTVGQSWGTDPARIEAVDADFFMPGSSKWRCHALTPAGLLGAEVPAEPPSAAFAGRTKFHLAPRYQTMWYLFSRE